MLLRLFWRQFSCECWTSVTARALSSLVWRDWSAAAAGETSFLLIKVAVVSAVAAVAAAQKEREEEYLVYVVGDMLLQRAVITLTLFWSIR
jgi:hypothetical protein